MGSECVVLGSLLASRDGGHRDVGFVRSVEDDLFLVWPR